MSDRKAMLREEDVSWGAVFGGKTGLSTLTLSLAVLLPAINVYIVVTILPSLIREIGGEAYYAWAATVFVAASLVGATLATKLFRHFGARVACSCAAAFFALGTFGCGMADTMEIFLSARLVQGFGGGLLMTLAYMMVRVVYPKNLWPRILSVISSIWGIATLLGPAIGGIFAEYDIWRAAFWLVGWLSVVFTLAVWAILPKPQATSADSQAQPLAFVQIVILLLSVLVISVGSVLDGVMAKIIGLGVGFSLLIVLARIEKRARIRLLPWGSFSLRAGHFYLYMLMLSLACCVNAAELYIPLFLQILHDVSPLWAGYIAALLSMGWTCGSIYSAPCYVSRQPLLLMSAPCFGLAGAILLLFFLPHPLFGPFIALTVICAGLFFMGVSAGIAWPHLLTRVMSWARSEDADRASTSLTLVQIFSAAFGSSLAGTLTNLAGLSPLEGQLVNQIPAQLLFVGLMVILSCALFFAYQLGALVRRESEG